MTLALRFAARSHVGLLREGNEDSGYAGPRLLAVADGMGGHAAGEVASRSRSPRSPTLDEDAPRRRPARRAAPTRGDGANHHLRDMVAGDPRLEGMGTTLTALLFAGIRLGLLHIGDSRAYLLRDGELSPDHPRPHLRADARRRGPHHRGGGEHPPAALALIRALDGRDGIEPDLSVREVRAGDRYLLCTDGLTGVVGDETLQRDARASRDPRGGRATGWSQLALRGGGPDNVTVHRRRRRRRARRRASSAPRGRRRRGRPSRRRPRRSGVGDTAAGARPARPSGATTPRRRGAEAPAGGASSAAGDGRRRPAARGCSSLLLGRRRRSRLGVRPIAVLRRRRRASRSRSSGASSGSGRSARPVSSVERAHRRRTDRLDRARRRASRAGRRRRATCDAAERSCSGCEERLPDCDARPHAGTTRRAPRPAPTASPTAPSPVAPPAARRAAPPTIACPADAGERRERAPPSRRRTPAPARRRAAPDRSSPCSIAVLAYAAVGLAVDGADPAGTLGYGARPRRRCSSSPTSRVRRLAPYADPLLLPVRRPAQRPRPGDDPPARPRRSRARAAARRRTLPAGEAPRAADLDRRRRRRCSSPCCWFVRDHRMLQRYTYTAAAAGLVAAAAAARCRCSASDHQRRADLDPRLGPFTLPAERGRQDAAHRVLRRLPGRQARRAVAGQPARRSGSTCRAPATSARSSSPGRPASRCSSSSKDLGTSLLFFGIFVAMLYVATERTTWLVIGLGLFVGGAFVAYVALRPRRSARVDIWLDPFADPTDGGLPAGAGAVRLRHTAGSSAPGWARGVPARCPSRAPTSSSPPSARSSAWSASWRSCSCLRRSSSSAGCARRCRCRDAFGKLLAAGLPFVARAAGVRRRRRRHPAHPAHRPDDCRSCRYGGSSLSPTGRWSRCCCASATPRAGARARTRTPWRCRGATSGRRRWCRRCEPPAAPARPRLRACCSACCSRTSTGSRSSQAEACRDGPAQQPACCCATYERERGPIAASRRPARSLAESVAHRRPAEVPAAVPRRTGVRPRHRLLLVRLRRAPASSGRRTASSPATDDRLFVSRVSDLLTGEQARRAAASS